MTLDGLRTAYGQDATRAATAAPERPEHTTSLPVANPDPWAALPAAADAVPVALLGIDVEGRIRLMNAAAREFLGRNVDDMLGRRLEALFDEADRARQLFRSLLSGDADEEPVMLRCGEGRKRSAEVASRVISGEDDQPRGWILSFHAPDASGRWAAARLEEFERCLRSMAHDLKSPLASLRGLVSLIDGGLREGLDPTEYTNDLRSNLLRVEELVQSLVDTCQDSELARDRRFVPSAQLLHQLKLEFKRDLDERGIELVLPANPPPVFANARRFRQVVMNLILNAMQHMGDVESPRIEIAIEAGSEADVMIVRDNGKGLPPTEQAQILELFRTASADTDEGWRSSGFGLSIVRRVIRAHGGEVELATEPGHGVQVRASFPRPLS